MARPQKGCATRGQYRSSILRRFTSSACLIRFAQQVAPPPTRGPDGLFRPVAQIEPMDDSFIGGWTMPVPRHPSPRPTQPESNGDGSGGVPTPMGIPGPSPLLSPHLQQTGYPFVRPPSVSVPPAQHGLSPSSYDSPLSQLSPVERSEALNLRKTTMQPYVQYMCGPLLRYDTVDEGVWHGAALIVSKCCLILIFFSVVGFWAGANRPLCPLHGHVAADAGSTYDPYPALKYWWNPKYTAPLAHQRQVSVQGTQGVDLGPHPADPMALHFGSLANDGYLEGPDVQERRVDGTEIYVYTGRGGCVSMLQCRPPYLVDVGIGSTYTFWRFQIHIPLAESEMKILYSINDGLLMDFFVPSYRQTMRLAAYSVSDPSYRCIMAP